MQDQLLLLLLCYVVQASFFLGKVPVPALHLSLGVLVLKTLPQLLTILYRFTDQSQLISSHSKLTDQSQVTRLSHQLLSSLSHPPHLRIAAF